MATRLLGVMDGEPEPDPGHWTPIWRDDRVDEEGQLEWLRISAVPEMMLAQGWEFFGSNDPERDRWSRSEAEMVLSADDPRQALDDWLADPPAPPVPAHG